MSSSNLNALATGLVPVLFILLLGFAAAKHRSFDPDQTSGFSSLVVGYTLPASLFIAIIKTPRSALVDDWRLLLIVALTFVVMAVVGYLVARRVFHRSAGEAAIAGLLVGSPGVPFFGTTILGPLFGSHSSVTVALMSIVINLVQVPLATVLLESDAGTAAGGAADENPPSSASATPPSSLGTTTVTQTAPPSAAQKGTGSVLVAALRKPMVLAPVLAIVLVLLGVRLPQLVTAMLTPLGQATSGVAVFAAGLTLGQQRFVLSWEVGWNVLGKMIIMPGVVLVTVLLFSQAGTGAQETVVASAIMSTTVAVILAGHYKRYAQQASSTLLLTALAMFAVLPVALVVAGSVKT